MSDSRPLLQAIRNGKHEFLREEFVDAMAFAAVVKELGEANDLGFIKGYRTYRSMDDSKEVIKVAAKHGLSDEGLDYLIRIGG